MNYKQSQEVHRDEVEKNMIFLGFLIVQNKLKSETIPTIEILRNAQYRMAMATGDNILTAISVAKECKLVHSDEIIYFCDIVKENGVQKLTWSKIEEGGEDEDIVEVILLNSF